MGQWTWIINIFGHVQKGSLWQLSPCGPLDCDIVVHLKHGRVYPTLYSFKCSYNHVVSEPHLSLFFPRDAMSPPPDRAAQIGHHVTGSGDWLDFSPSVIAPSPKGLNATPNSVPIAFRNALRHAPKRVQYSCLSTASVT